MKTLILTILSMTLSLTASIGQLPEKAEDISPLLAGEIFPDLQVTALNGESVSTQQIFSEKSTVLVFYRGGWCPYCNTHLSELGKNEAEILNLGYQIVAISPDAAEGLQKTTAKAEINYRLFSDASGDLAKSAGIAFQAPEKYGKMLSESSGGKNEGFLPVPSVFVLNTSGEILFEYINPNYKKRLSGDLLLAVLKALKAEQ